MSSKQLTIFKIGCYLAFATAALHFWGYTQGFKAGTDNERQMFDLMTQLPLGLPGAPSHTTMDLLNGFSMMYTLMLGLTGGIGLIVARRGVQDPTLMLAIARTLAGAYFVMVVIGFTNFFIIPTVCMALVLACFAIASVRSKT